MLAFSLLALSVGQRLCINFFVPRANFLTTLRSHLDVTCSTRKWIQDCQNSYVRACYGIPLRRGSTYIEVHFGKGVV